MPVLGVGGRAHHREGGQYTDDLGGFGTDGLESPEEVDGGSRSGGGVDGAPGVGVGTQVGRNVAGPGWLPVPVRCVAVMPAGEHLGDAVEPGGGSVVAGGGEVALRVGVGVVRQLVGTVRGVGAVGLVLLVGPCLVGSVATRSGAVILVGVGTAVIAGFVGFRLRGGR